MEAGVVGTRGAAFWHKDRRDLGADSLGSRVIVGRQVYDARRCEACQLVLLDYSQL